jgi:hypothetical protein
MLYCILKFRVIRSFISNFGIFSFTVISQVIYTKTLAKKNPHIFWNMLNIIELEIML